MALTVREAQEQSASRLKRWHDPDDPWSPLEWAGAMGGEAGEAANVAKKLRRLEGKIKNLDKRQQIVYNSSFEQAAAYRDDLAKEVADTILYGLCLFEVLGKDAETVLRDVFNQKSIECGFPERL